MKIVPAITLADIQKMTIKINAKVVLDGTGGELHDFLILKEIDLPTNITNIGIAIGHETNWKQYKYDAESKIAFYQKNLTLVESVIRGIGQDLKVDLSPDLRDIGLWGYNLDHEAELVYPTTDQEWIRLWNAVYLKYSSYGVGLAPIEKYVVSQGWVMATINTNMGLAETAKDDSIDMYNESYIEERAMTTAMVTPDADNTLIIDKLKVLHPNDFRDLGLYGIQTSNAAPKEHDQTSSILPSGHKTLASIVLPSVMKNLNNWDLQVFKGKDMTGSSRTLLANGTLPMGDGDSYSTVFNPDTTRLAKVGVEVWR
jgi:hypothetical protein